MKKILPGLLLLIVGVVQAQMAAKPKLVVGIVVDQMRWDFLYRFYDRYGAGGFKRMLNEGFSCENTFIPYTPTYTAAGHACVYTGSTPAFNGIAGNSWYDREKKKVVYCTEDSTVTGVGTTSDAGEMSPRNMWATTVSDELRLSNNFKSKVIGIALKDRGSILPAGHSANAAYWFDNTSGGWITSTYYMQNLPQWMVQLNNKKLPDAYLAKNWTTLYPLNTYTQSTADERPYEGSIPGEDNNFPHKTDALTGNKYESFRYTPAANTYTLDAARAAIEGEALGSRSVTDLLAVSFSTPDYIGHTFGPNSVEIEDMYLRLDKDLADFFTYLDTKFGKGQYLAFLTADHAVAQVANFAKENKLPAGTSSWTTIQRTVNEALQKEFGTGNYVQSVINSQVYLNNDVIQANKLDKAAMKKTVIRTLMLQPGIMRAIDLENLQQANLPDKVNTVIVNGYNQKLSGDVQYINKPGWYEGGERGTTHGSWNPYDSHIPLLWYGWNIKKGKTNREVYMTDIAPTLAALLSIQMPNATIGKVIEEVTNNTISR
jgi:predicted AlkP superfamily pyrophosphatase or phosphodiesterase